MSVSFNPVRPAFGMALGPKSLEVGSLGGLTKTVSDDPDVRKMSAVEDYVRSLQRAYERYFTSDATNRAQLFRTLDSTLRYLLPDDNTRPTTIRKDMGGVKATFEIDAPWSQRLPGGPQVPTTLGGVSLNPTEKQALAELLLAQAEAALEKAPASMVRAVAQNLEELPYPVTPEMDELIAGALKRILGKAKAGSADTNTFRLAVGIRGPEPETDNFYLEKARKQFMQLFKQAGVDFNA